MNGAVALLPRTFAAWKRVSDVLRLEEDAQLLAQLRGAEDEVREAEWEEAAFLRADIVAWGQTERASMEQHEATLQTVRSELARAEYSHSKSFFHVGEELQTARVELRYEQERNSKLRAHGKLVRSKRGVFDDVLMALGNPKQILLITFMSWVQAGQAERLIEECQDAQRASLTLAAEAELNQREREELNEALTLTRKQATEELASAHQTKLEAVERYHASRDETTELRHEIQLMQLNHQAGVTGNTEDLQLARVQLQQEQERNCELSAHNKLVRSKMQGCFEDVLSRTCGPEQTILMALCHGCRLARRKRCSSIATLLWSMNRCF